MAIALGAVVLMSTACTPEEISQWMEWHSKDPRAANAYVMNAEVQASLSESGSALEEAVRLNPPPPPPPPQAVSNNSVWDRLAQCESGGNWSINTGNGYFGGLQFSLSTWRNMGGTGYPHQNSREEQIRVAERTLDAGGWGQWPACSRKLGLR